MKNELKNKLTKPLFGPFNNRVLLTGSSWYLPKAGFL